MCCVTFQIKEIDKEFHVLLSIMLYKVVLILESEEEMLLCEHSNENC